MGTASPDVDHDVKTIGANIVSVGQCLSQWLSFSIESIFLPPFRERGGVVGGAGGGGS